MTTTKQSTLLILDLADFRNLMAHHLELARVIEAEGKRRLGTNQRQHELHDTRHRELSAHARAAPSLSWRIAGNLIHLVTNL